MGRPTDGSWHFLPTLGTSFHDFAGSTVVHTIGGMISLAGAMVLGPRLGRKFKRDGGGPMLPHDLTIAVCRRLAAVVRLVRIQSGQHAVRDGLCRVSAASPRTRRWPPAPVVWARSSTPTSCGQEVGRCRNHERLPGGSCRDHLPLLLGQPDRRRDSWRHRRVSSCSWLSNCSNTCALTIRSARFRSTESAVSGARSPSVCSRRVNLVRPVRRVRITQPVQS